MTDRLCLSIVDQSPVRKGSPAAQALQETIELAVLADRLGYTRFWVAEHHNHPTMAGTSPEIMLGTIAGKTRSIRVGSGGVMLTHYSALKVAENFRVLESLYPGRIDLGIGRAPGSDQQTAAALAFPTRSRDLRQYPDQVRDLLGYLANDISSDHPFAHVRASPSAGDMPAVWLLGSGIDSARLAARLGLPFSYAAFANSTAEEGPPVIELYRRSFCPSRYLEEPKVNIAVCAACADTQAQAEAMAASHTYLQGSAGPAANTATQAAGTGTAALLDRAWQPPIIGAPAQVRAGLQEFAQRYQTNDISIVNIWYEHAARVRSFELIAEAVLET